MEIKFKFSNGDRLKDVITFYEGIVTGAACYITGCNQYLITAMPKDKFSDAERVWIDEGRLVLMQSQAVKLDAPKSDNERGSDISAPKK